MDATTRRAVDIAAVTMRHGAAALLDCLDLSVLAPRWHASPVPRPSPGAVQLRRTLEELGPTFMKLGQVLSTRPDMVPPHYEAELARLQDAGPVVPAVEITNAINETFGRPPNELFDMFEMAPIAAASIGQVHPARLTDGRDVVVKVRRPHVVSQVDLDLDVLTRITRSLARSSSLAARYDPAGLAHEFASTLRAELDYQQEGRNAELIASAFADNDDVRVPEIIWNLTSNCVITEERILGIKVDDLQALDAAGIDRPQTARRFANAYLSMVFVHQFFHADPHPGNVFVEPDGRIGFVDFGMVGSINEGTGQGLATILLALVSADSRRMADGLLGLGIAGVDIDRTGFEADLERLLERYAHEPLERLHLRVLLVDLMAVVRAHRLRLPSDIALLLKTVMMCEGVAAQLDPKFELIPMLLPYASTLIANTENGA
jgi:ubiquinone biosynthesis protein